MAYSRYLDNVNWFMGDLVSRVVAESGRPDDRFHLGKLILRSFKDYPHHILQIDGITGEFVTNKEIMERSIRCATCFRNMGMAVGDVAVIMSASNINVSVPFYASLFTGVAVAAIDHNLSTTEMVGAFGMLEPKIIFCQSDRASDIQLVMNKMDLNAYIVSFDKGDYLSSLEDFFEKFGDNCPAEEFQATDLDDPNAVAFLISTSGTTGLPKAAEATHKNFVISTPLIWGQYTNFPSPVHMTMMGAPLQWLTSIAQYVATALFVVTRLESSKGLTPEIACYFINTYKPSYTILSPTLMTSIRKAEERCDLTCFKQMLLGGSAVPADLLASLKEEAPDMDVSIAFGMSELCGLGLLGYTSEQGARQMRIGSLQYKLVNIETTEEILQPDTPGELWLKGPNIFKGYHKNEMATNEAFAEGRWFKTGDMFYRDEFWNYYFVERIKLLLKYKSYQISPVEVEDVIRGHPGVLDVAVTGVQDDECGDLPVACVVRRTGYENIADEIKEIVRESLSDAKQLRGGVIFLDALPVTATTKIHRQKLKELAKSMHRY